MSTSLLLDQSRQASSDSSPDARTPRGGREQVAPFIENISEATVACLITMVQGNVLALGLSHWLIASQTGVVAGAVTAAAILFSGIRRRWIIACVLGVVTAAVDYYIHPGMFGPIAAEALATGIGAALLSLLLGSLWNRFLGKS